MNIAVRLLLLSVLLTGLSCSKKAAEEKLAEIEKKEAALPIPLNSDLDKLDKKYAIKAVPAAVKKKKKKKKKGVPEASVAPAPATPAPIAPTPAPANTNSPAEKKGRSKR